MSTSTTERRMSSDELAAIGHVIDLIDGYHATCVIVAATQLGLFAQLGAGPLAEDVLAERVAADPPSLRRLTRALCSLGLAELDGPHVALTAAGRMLEPRTRGLAELVTLVSAEYLPAWAQLAESVRTGQPVFEQLFGMSAWEHRRQHPELGAAFNLMTSGGANHQVQTIAKTYDFASRRHVVDVGGGSGYLLAGILSVHSSITGTLFDLPQVVGSADAVLDAAGVRQRSTVVGGSFLDGDVPAGGDVYIVKHILHDWDDDVCISILKKIRAVMAPNGVLLVIEALCPEASFHEPAARTTIMRDLHMMTVLGGRERTAAAYGQLVATAGFALASTIPAGGPSILECHPV